MSRQEELSNTVWYTVLWVGAMLIVVAGLIAAGLMVQNVVMEPKFQQAYQFEVTSKLTDWCGASPTDPFNQQTLASLKANRDGEPDRFEKLSPELQRSINSAIQGDHVGACGY